MKIGSVDCGQSLKGLEKYIKESLNYLCRDVCKNMDTEDVGRERSKESEKHVIANQRKENPYYIVVKFYWHCHLQLSGK
jgi:hypothetical protein